MGTKVESENYLPWQFSMRDLNHEPNGVDWPSCYNDVNLPNGESYNGNHPRTNADSHIGYDKDLVKQTMLNHEAIFKGQVYELHRLYRVQRDLMDELNRKHLLQQRIPYEASSSSSPLPLHIQPKDNTRTCNGSTFPFTNPGFTRPLTSGPDNMQSSPNSVKGKSILAGPSPKNSGVSESRPTKLRKRNLDLELPADEFIGADEVEQFGRGKYIVNVSSSPDEDVKPTFRNGRMFPSYSGKGLADLNQPFHVEETTTVGSHVGTHRDVPARFMNGNGSLKVNGMSNNLSDVRGNGQNLLCSALESEHCKASVKSINLGILPEKARVPAQSVQSQPPAFLRSNHIKVEPWKLKSFSVTDNSDCNYPLSNNHGSQTAPSWVKPEFLGQKPISFQPNPFLFGLNLSKSHQPPVGNGFYQNSSPVAHFPSPGFNYANYNSGNNFPCNTKNSSNPLKEMNLNVSLPNGVPDDYNNNPKAPSTVLPWLRGKDSTNESGNSRLVKSESSRKIFGVSIFGNTSISTPKVENHNEEIECRERKVLFDMNIPCEEQDKMTVDEATKPLSMKVGNNFDLNSCITEEEIEIPRAKVGTGIDLEALMDNEIDSDDEDHEIATSAASAIVAMSSFVNNPIQTSLEETTCPPPMEDKEDDILHRFTSQACSRRVGPDGLPIGLDDFECTILKQKECTPKEYFPEPSTPDFKFLENNNTCALTKKPRKGQARRGRQKRDFQRDILPGLTTLSRVEVTEDLNSFGGVLGSNRTRNGRGRGRRRLVMDEAICPSPLKEAEEVRINNKVEGGVEDVSFTGWGKTTRRPRRQRCPPRNHALSLPLT